MGKGISKVMSILEKEFGSLRQPTVRRTSKTRDPFKVLITCLLSLRTQDKNTGIASRRLFEHASTPKEIVKMPVKKLEKLIFSSGHYRKKARVLKHVSGELIKRFDSKVPNTKDELLSIKGIGPKTANIVLAFAYGKLVIPVDTNVHRISNRLGLVKTKRPEDTEKELMKIIPKRYWKELNTTFILHGKTICKPISPICSICPVKDLCPKIGVTKSR